MTEQNKLFRVEISATDYKGYDDEYILTIRAKNAKTAENIAKARAKLIAYDKIGNKSIDVDATAKIKMRKIA